MLLSGELCDKRNVNIMEMQYNNICVKAKELRKGREILNWIEIFFVVQNKSTKNKRWSHHQKLVMQIIDNNFQ